MRNPETILEKGREIPLDLWDAINEYTYVLKEYRRILDEGDGLYLLYTVAISRYHTGFARAFEELHRGMPFRFGIEASAPYKPNDTSPIIKPLDDDAEIAGVVVDVDLRFLDVDGGQYAAPVLLVYGQYIEGGEPVGELDYNWIPVESIWCSNDQSALAVAQN